MLNPAYCIIVAQCPLSYGLTPHKQEILSDYVLQNHDHIYTLQHYIDRTYIDPKTRAALSSLIRNADWFRWGPPFTSWLDLMIVRYDVYIHIGSGTIILSKMELIDIPTLVATA